MGKLYWAAQVLADREPCSGAAADRAWERFREKYLPFAENGGIQYEDGDTPSSDAALGRRHFPSRRWLCGALAAAVLAAVLLSASVAGTAVGGYDLWGKMFAWWTDEELGLAPGQIGSIDWDDIRIPEDPGSYAGIGEALEDCGLSLPLVPRWIPEGFEIQSLTVDEMKPDVLIFFTRYARGNENLVININIYVGREDGGGSFGSFQKDGGDPVPYETGGVTHLLTTNAGMAVALWANGPAECAVSGNITIDELKQMIDSIYE